MNLLLRKSIKKLLKNLLWILLLYFSLYFLRDFSAYALVTTESDLLGGNIGDKRSVEADPLDYVFRPASSSTSSSASSSSKKDEIKSKLQLYYFVDVQQQGDELIKFCSKDIDYSYGSPEAKTRAIRSLVATLQYIGLDLTTRAIAEYARYFEFTEAEYNQMTKKLIANYCTMNLTVISLKQLTKNLISKFRYPEKSSELLDFSKNVLFPPSLDKMLDLRKGKELEFLRTIKLFRAFCSWHGDVDDFRLLVPILRNPEIISWVIKQIIGVSRIWNQSYQAKWVRDPKTLRVLCEGMICRRITNETEFLLKFPRTLGGKDLQQELSVRYCHDLRELKYVISEQEEHIKKWIVDQNLQEEIFLQSQLMYLITGIPDLLGRIEKYSDAKVLLRLSIDRDWDEWAQNANKLFSKEMLFEESMTLERGEPEQDHHCLTKWNSAEQLAKQLDACWTIPFDLNLGEFDRTLKGLGKLSIHYDLKLRESFLGWFWHEYIYYSHPKYNDKREKLLEVLKKTIESDLEKLRKKFTYAPWEGDIASQIVSGILELYDKSEITFNRNSDRVFTIRLKFNYGLFALKYFYYRQRADHGDPTIDLTQ